MAKLGKDYRNTALGLLRRKDGKLLIILNPRNNSLDKSFVDKNTYKFPQGGIEENEDPNKALIREINEELGIDLKEFKKEMLTNHISYWFKNKKLPDFEIRLHAFLVDIGDLDETNLKVDCEEVAELRWVSPNEVQDLDLGIRYHAYMSILRKFSLI